MLRRCAGLALLLVGVTACGNILGPTGTAAPTGVVIITAGGTALGDGAADVPPTLDLGIQGDGIGPGEVTATLDGRPLKLAAAAGRLTAETAPMAYGSSHALVVDVLGRQPDQIGFQVVDRTQVSAAAWLDPAGGLVTQVVFERAADQAAIAAALPGARLEWFDPTHLGLSWSSPPAALILPAGLPASRGSVLDGPLTLPLAGIQPGQLRRATVPAAPATPPGLALTLWTVDGAASHTSTRSHASQVAVLSPTGWQVGAGGDLQGTPDPVTLATGAAAGRPVWPLLANDASDPTATDQFLHSSPAETSLVEAVVGQVRRLHLAGVNLDFEGVPGADETALTGFVTQLAGALHAAGARLSVDVVPHDASGVNAASAAYDDPALAAVADQLVVMAYDEHTSAGAPGPVAGLDWQTAELAATLDGVPPAKAVLGIPLYARRWSAGQVSAADYSSAVAQALTEPGLAYDYDFAAATPDLDSEPGGVPTQLWFDDADSLLRKVAAVQRLGLAGIAAWRAGFEDPAFWSVV